MAPCENVLPHVWPPRVREPPTALFQLAEVAFSASAASVFPELSAPKSLTALQKNW